MDVLRTINDPEMPISIVDLGIVERIHERAGAISVDITPTFVGCPALEYMRREIVERVGHLPGAVSVTVNFVFDPPWSVDRISAAGRAALQRFGVTAPAMNPPAEAAGSCGSPSADENRPAAFVPLGVPAASAPEACPFCGSSKMELDSPFGPTRCKMIYYCASCRNSFEHLKRV